MSDKPFDPDSDSGKLHSSDPRLEVYDELDDECERDGDGGRRWFSRQVFIRWLIAVLLAVAVVALLVFQPWRKTLSDEPRDQTALDEMVSHMRLATSDEVIFLSKMGVLPPWADEEVMFAEEDFTIAANTPSITIVVPEGIRWKGGALDLVSLIRFQKWEEDPAQFVRIYDRLCEVERLTAMISNIRSDGQCRGALRASDEDIPSSDKTAKWHDASEEEMRTLLPNYDPKIDQRGLIFEGKGPIPHEITFYKEHEPRRENWRTIIIRWGSSLTQLGGPLDRIRVEGVWQPVVDQLCWGVARPAFANAHPDTFAPEDSARHTNCRLN